MNGGHDRTLPWAGNGSRGLTRPGAPVDSPGMATPTAPPPTPSKGSGASAKSRLVIGLVVAGGLALVVWLAISVIPRWWSQRVGGQVEGDLTTGAILGFMYGFFAMALPLLVLAAVVRFWRRSWKAWLVGGAIALLLASPNLMTLGITLGGGSAAHAADRTLDVEAPYFRGGQLIGAIAAFGLFAYFTWVMVSRRRARRRAEAEPKSQRAA